ncbi:MAG: glycosylasparaginase, partial [Spirosomataceae bacterium]
MKRRTFLQQTTALATLASASSKASNLTTKTKSPIVISTWKNEKANTAAWESLQKTGRALDAVEAGARIPEADPNDTSVGYGGFP